MRVDLATAFEMPLFIVSYFFANYIKRISFALVQLLDLCIMSNLCAKLASERLISQHQVANCYFELLLKYQNVHTYTVQLGHPQASVHSSGGHKQYMVMMVEYHTEKVPSAVAVHGNHHES